MSGKCHKSNFKKEFLKLIYPQKDDLRQNSDHTQKQAGAELCQAPFELRISYSLCCS